MLTGVIILLMAGNSFSQMVMNRPAVREMRWSGNYELYLYLSDDSTAVLNTKDLPHWQNFLPDTVREQFTFLPASLDQGYVRFLQQHVGVAESADAMKKENRTITLWGALHESLGGGYIHFMHCLQYALETGFLDLKAPLLKRPETRWRPTPATETWKRTRKWKYYTPDNQKLAIKEYRLRQLEGKTEVLAGIPDEMINLFVNTSEKDYQKMIQQKAYREKSRIDLIRLLLGSPYLGEAQIAYIRAMVMKSVTQYSAFRLPAVIIMDEYKAAVAMSLDERGYRVEQIVFSDEASLDAETRMARIQAITGFAARINQRNNQVFENRLRHYFGE